MDGIRRIGRERAHNSSERKKGRSEIDRKSFPGPSSGQENRSRRHGNRSRSGAETFPGDPGAQSMSPGTLGGASGRSRDRPGAAKIVHVGTIRGSKIGPKRALAPKMLPLDPFSDMSGPVMAQSTVFVRNLVDVLISRPSRNTAHGDEFEVRHVLAHASGRPTKIN